MSRESKTHTLVVRQQENGYFYVGHGRSIAEGPFRRPEHVAAAAADLVPEGEPWSIEVFDKSGKRMMGFESPELKRYRAQ